VISEEEWLALKRPKIPFGRWLIDNIPAVGELELPDRNEPDRETPVQRSTRSVNGFLLDTNVFSELVKPAPDRVLVEFLSKIGRAWLTIISVARNCLWIEAATRGKASYWA
jgi:hypothetical protein